MKQAVTRPGGPKRKQAVDSTSWHAPLQVLFDHAWLGRIWTFQELILSRSPLVLFGDSVILWEDLVSTVLITPQSIKGQERWLNLILLWLDFPRHRYSERLQPGATSADIDCEHAPTPGGHTFRKLIDSCDLNDIDPPWHFTMFCCGFQGIKLWLWAFGLWFKRIIAALVEAAVLTLDCVILANYAGKTSASHWPFPLFVILLLITPFTTALAWWYWRWHRPMSLGQILHGTDRQGVYKSTLSSDSSNMIILEALWTALRTRKSSNEHDMAHGLAAILQDCGVMISSPDYSQSTKMTFQNLFQDILSWEPRAIQMIVDAGVVNPSTTDWPSWLPDWRTPESNTWLYGESNPKHTWLRHFPQSSRPPAISGEKLSVSGRRFDKIEKCFRFGFVNLQDRHLLLDALASLMNFMEIVYGLPAFEAGKHRSGTIFAVLKGLLVRPEPGEMTYRDPTDGSFNIIDLEDPVFDFPRFSMQFDNFRRLNEIAYELCKDRTDQRDTYQAAEELLNRVRENQDVLGYLIESLNTLADEKRCIFVLSSGKVGSGSHLAAAGDEVLIIQGVLTPVAAREKMGQNFYQLLGPVLVHAVFMEENWHNGHFDDIILE